MPTILKGGHATDIAKQLASQLHPTRNYQVSFMAGAALSNSAPLSGSGLGNIGGVGSTGSDVGTYTDVSVPGTSPNKPEKVYGQYSGANGYPGANVPNSGNPQSLDFDSQASPKRLTLKNGIQNGQPAYKNPTGTVLPVTGVSDIPLKGVGGEALRDDLMYGDIKYSNNLI